MLHTHFGSATHLLGAVLEVALGFTFLKLVGYHGLRSRHQLVRGLAGALLVQVG